MVSPSLKGNFNTVYTLRAKCILPWLIHLIAERLLKVTFWRQCLNGLSTPFCLVSLHHFRTMFYSENVLTRKGPLANIWLAAHWDRKLTKSQIVQTNIQTSVGKEK